MSHYTDAADKAYQFLIALEERAIDNADQRFYASYLLGHLSLISDENEENAEQLGQRLSAALDEAFGVDRLSDQDKTGIRSLWQAISADIGLGL
ncbi:YfcL family protein [Marinobacterium lacunae]|uniref:YfcL family protein n=1 Tax=Marinobacterium lacunae TaxID=1232683 RepID=UPI00056309DE|nr:YfcL family protein [Marinobacterium lacunae]MBR9884742.1 YfcL family protein [Oceanospirillales bacterium]